MACERTCTCEPKTQERHFGEEADRQASLLGIPAPTVLIYAHQGDCPCHDEPVSYDDFESPIRVGKLP